VKWIGPDVRTAALVTVMAAISVPGTWGQERVHSFDVASKTFSVDWILDASNTSKAAVQVSGLSPAVLRQLRRSKWESPQWQQLLAVFAATGDAAALPRLPPVSGIYRVLPDVLRFELHFPLESGLTYQAIFQPSRLPGGRASGDTVMADFRAPARPPGPSTVVTHVYPSSESLPENLLKFYIHFSAAMSRGRIYDHIHLRKGNGIDIELPFLEIDEELWDPSMTRLTLFIDPGRIKREVRPLEEIGPALEAGKSYALVIDPEWKDSLGNPLQRGFQKAFTVGPADREPPDAGKWQVSRPKPGTREMLTVTFPEPMDHALAQRVIHVTDASGRPVVGNVALENDERRWVFTPNDQWLGGNYHLIVQTTIEDLAGNNIGKPFEVDLFESVQRRPLTPTVTLSFTVR